MNNQFGTAKKLIIRKFKFNSAPFLISKEDYWGYINTSQMYYKARTVINFKTITSFFLILLAAMYLHDGHVSQIEFLILCVMTLIFSVPTIFAAKNKFWIGLLILALIFLGLSVWAISYGLIPVLAVIIGYLSLSHLIMLIRVRKMAAIQSI